jgi:8-oxo-dGTP diphosphatase
MAASFFETLDWSCVPTFGRCADPTSSVIRPSAYGLIQDEHRRLALAHNSEGVFLPGGGIEAGETPAQAIARESLEECGLVARLGAWTLYAVQFVYSEKEQTHFQKRSIFIGGECDRFGALPTEPGYELRWVDHESAIRMLSDESQRWAVQQWAKH